MKYFTEIVVGCRLKMFYFPKLTNLPNIFRVRCQLQLKKNTYKIEAVFKNEERKTGPLRYSPYLQSNLCSTLILTELPFASSHTQTHTHSVQSDEKRKWNENKRLKPSARMRFDLDGKMPTGSNNRYSNRIENLF